MRQLFCFLVVYGMSIQVVFSQSDSLAIVRILEESRKEQEQLRRKFEDENKLMAAKLDEINRNLNVGSFTSNTERDNYIKTLNDRIVKTEELSLNQKVYELSNLRIRYKKGIDLIRILYEKTLDLEHHFQDLKTHDDIAKLSNPMQFPDFVTNLNVLKTKLDKRHQVQLPSFLLSNPYITGAYTLITSLIGGGEKDLKDREETLKRMNCILDFTARMTSDLKIIYFETEYLKARNEELKINCEKLFAEYTSAVGYRITIKECRDNDLWDELANRIANAAEQTETELRTQYRTNPNFEPKRLVDLQFSIERLVDFINEYSSLVNQCNSYYSKFYNIIKSYEGNDCTGQLPVEFSQLSREIKNALDKFNNAYILPDLKGSRLKDLLYGSQGS
jgi:hypothetical protein